MERFSKVMLLCSAAVLSLPFAHAQSDPNADSSATMATKPSGMPGLPPAPRGKSTIIGGAITKVDPVLDQFSLKAFGQKPIKVLFDERTEVYRDGNRIPLRDLSPQDHASVQTVLDGSNVFALSIHMLSQTPQGDVQGHVEDFDAGTGQLTVRSSLSRQAIRLEVRPDTQISRQGQSAFTAEHSGTADLMPGAMVSIKFETGKQGKGVASRIVILATPGATFIFSGNLTSLDMHTGVLVLVDPRDDKSYQISFSSTGLPGTQNLHTGDHVRVSANFDGNHYVATDITTY